MPVCYTVEEFAGALGYTPEDWGLSAHQTITLTDNDQIVACDRLMGHVTPTEREMLERRAANPLPSSPSRARWLWIGGAVAVALLLGGAAYARFRKATEISPPSSPEEAVDRAISLLGTARDPQEIADAAYPMAYPDCPPTLDPDDLSHAACIEDWWRLHDLAEAALPAGGSPPSEASPPSDEGRPPQDDGTLPTTGPAADMRAWLESLTQTQRAQLRTLIGATHYDPIKHAAYAGDDAQTVSAVLRFKNAAEKMLSDDPIAAAKRYSELRALLGPKLDELLAQAKKYQG